jgi:hypothetical protein
MSINAVKWALRARNLSDIHKLVLITLAECHNEKTGKCFPSQKSIADTLGKGERSIRRHLDALEATGFIERKHQYDKKGHRGSDAYILHFEITQPTGQLVAGSLPANMSPVGDASLPAKSESLPAKIVGTTGQLVAGTIDEPESITGIVEPEKEPPLAASKPIVPHDVWTKGKPILMYLGLSGDKAGKVIGKWIKETKDKDRVYEAIKVAGDEGTGDPVALITKILQAQGPQPRRGGYEQHIAAAVHRNKARRRVDNVIDADFAVVGGVQ